MAERPIFFKDDYLGEFDGDILGALAPLFPLAMAQQIRQHSPVCCKWRVFELITWVGHCGHRFYTEQLACDALNRICAAMYEERYHTPGYPGFYCEDTEEAGLPKVCIRPAYFVVWQSEKVQVPTPAESHTTPDNYVNVLPVDNVAGFAAGDYSFGEEGPDLLAVTCGC